MQMSLCCPPLRPHYEAKDADYSHHYSVAPSNHLIAEEPFLERDTGTKYEIPTVPWSDSVSGLNLASSILSPLPPPV